MTEGVLYELWSPCLDCQENKRTCEFHYGSICQGSHPCWQLLNALIDPLGLCNKNFKCKPWRRKSLFKDVSKWTCFDLMLTTTFLLFFLSTKLVQGVSYFLQKTSSFKRNSNFLWGLLFISSFGGISFPLALCQEGIQPESSLNRLELPNAVVYVGSPFNYNIPENVFDCEVDRILVSESADRFLSNWLAFNSDKKQLYGVPSEKDKGTYIILVVALMGEGNAGVHICGSRSFSIKVVPVREQLPVSVYISTGATGDDDKPVSRSFCVPGAQVVQGTAVLNADVESLNGHERMTMILKMAEHLSMPSDRVSFFSGHASHPIVDQLDSPAVIAAGAGDGRFAKGSRSLLTWLIGCGAIKLGDLPLSKLDADAQDGTISTLLGVPVVGWHVISGAQRNRAKRRVRRQVMGVTATPTPMPSSSPPTTRSSVSTFVIISPTTILTSASSDSSTILLSATSVSSLALNATIVSSSAINIKSRVSTQPLSTTKILLPSALNISRSMELSTLASSFSTPSLTITTTKSVSSSVISSLSLSTTSIMNSSLTQVSPSQTLVSQVSAVSLLNSTRLVTSSMFPTSYSSQTLPPSVSQMNSSEVSRPSSFLVSFSVPISPVSSFSVLSSGSPNLTTLQFTSETTSTPQLNLSTRMLSSSPSLLTTFAINSSVLTTGFLNNISTSMRTLESLNPFSSFLTLSETTVVGNTSSIFGEMETTAVLNRTTRKLTPRHTSTVSTMSSVVTNTSSFVASSFHSSTTMLSSSFFWLSSPTLPLSATASVVVENLTSSSVQPNISSTAVAVSSLTASPIVTSLNFRSMETSVNASFVLVNSTSEISRSLSPSLRPTGNGTFSTTTTEVGISSETINGSAVVISNSPSLSIPSFASFAALSSFRSEFTGSRTSDSSVFATSSLFGGNSTTVPRTLGSSSSVVTTPSNLSVHSITTRKLFTFFSTPAAKSSTLVPSSSTSFPTASPSVAASPFSKQILPSSTILLRDSSSLFEASASVVESSVNATNFVASSTVVSRGTVRFENKSSIVTSTLAPQSLRTATRSITVLSGTSLQIPTTIQPTSRIFASSLSVFGGRSSPLLSSRFGINSSATVPTSVSETLTTTRSTPIFVTVTPSSLSTKNVSALMSFTGLASAMFSLTPVVTRSSPTTAIYSSFVDVSGRIPTSSSLLSTTVTPANKTSSVGFLTVRSRELVTHSSTFMETDFSLVSTGSRITMVTQSSSLSQKRSTIFTSSHALSVTPVVTGESSTVLVTRSFVQSSVSKETTKAQAYGSTVTSLLATVPQSSILIQTESLLQNNSFSGGSVTPEVSSREILTRLTLQSSRVESTEVTSSLEISTTSGVISKRSISVTSRVSSMTLSQPSNIESVLSKPLSVGSAIVTKSPKTLTSSPSQTLTVAASVTSLASTPILTSSLIGSVTPTFQSTVTLFSFDPSSNTFTFLTTSFKSRAFFLRTSAVISSRAIKVTSQISSVTLSLHTNVDSFLSKPLSASSAIVTKSPKTHTLTVTSRVTASVTSLTSTPVVTSSVEGSVTPTFHSIVTPFSFRPSSDTSPETALLTMSVQPSLLTSPRQLSGSRRLPGVTRVYSSRRSQITSTRVIHGSSLSVPTLSSIKTSSLFSSFGKSSEVSVKPTSIISRISTRVSSADFFVSSMFQSSPSILPSSNSTQMLTPTVSVVTLSVMPSSSIFRPTTAPPNSPPQLYNDMGRISVTAGKALNFEIPDDTFYDSEDQATTRGLSLSIVFSSGASIPSDFWLQFDNITQTIYGLPLSAHVPSGVTGETFILQAQDSQGAVAFDAFEVFVVPSEKPVVQELKIRVANDFLSFSRNVSQRLLLLEKIAAYFGDLDRSVIRVLEFAPGSVIMTWTNDSLPTDNCDEKKLEYVANGIFIDGEIREEFKDALEGFPVESGSQRRLGVCNESEVDGGATIIPAQQTHVQESDLWYKHVLVGLLVVVLVVVFVVLLVWYCRRRRPRPFNEKRTFKKRKPIILGQEIELKPIPGKPLVLPDDDPSKPPSYMSETSFDQPVSSDDDDDDDEVDYGKRSPLVRYEPPPPFHAALADDPRTSPPPAYVMPPMY